MRFLILVLAVYGPLVFASPPLTCGYTAEQNKPPFSVAGCPSGVTSFIYTTPDTNNVLPPIGSSQITIYMEATILATCGVPGDLYLYTLRKTSNDASIISMGYSQGWSTLMVVAPNLVGVNSGKTFPLTGTVTYVLTYDLATGKGFAGVITATDKLFWTSSAAASSMTSFGADMTLYLCANVYTHAGFQCQIDVLKVWPIYDESFLLSFLFGQTPNPLLLYVLAETSGTSAANAYNPATSTSATLSTTGATLPTWAITGIGINITDPSQYISLPAFILGGANTYMRGSFTISTWIKIAAAPATDRYIFLRKSNVAALRAAVALTSARKVKVILESSTSYTQISNGVVPLNTWTSITVTIVQTITAWGYAASAIVINNVFDVGQLNSQVQAAMTSYTLLDVNMIGGGPNSLVGVYAHFTIYSPGSMAFTSPPCPVSTGSNGDLGYGVTQSLILIPICDPNCDGCYGTSAAQCFSCAAGRGLHSGLCTICPPGTYLQGSNCINSPPVPNDEMGAAEAAALAAKIGVIAMAGIAGTTFVLKANPALLWALINFLQMFYYLTFINVDYPLNVQIFLEIFQVAALDFIPNPIENIFSDAEKNSVQVPGKYDYYEVEGLFLINSYPILLTWGVYILFYLFALLARICVPKDSKTLVKYISKIVDWYQWSGLIGILIASYPDIVQSAFLQIRALTFSSALFSVSSVLSIIFTIFGVGLPLLFIVIIQKNSSNLTNLEKKYQILVEKCNIDSALPRYVATIFLVRAMILDAALVLLQYYPVVQISFLIGSSSIILLILVFKRNIFTSLMDTYCRILQELFFVVLYINILLLSIEANTFSYEAKINVGWIIIGSCGVIFSAFLVNALYESFQPIKEFFRNFRHSRSEKQSEKRGKQRVQESNDTTQYDIENSDSSISHRKAPLNLNSSLETSYNQPRLGENKVIATLDQLHPSKHQSRSFCQNQGNITKPSPIQGQSVSGLDLQRIGTVANTGDRSSKIGLSSTPEKSNQNTKKKNSGKDTIKHMNPIFRSELNKYK